MSEGADSYRDSLLAPGRNVWRVETANRFAVLMENAAYFDALSSALTKAQRSIVLLGWQFDPRTRLDPQSRAGDRQAEIGHQLRLLVKSKPELDVRLQGSLSSRTAQVEDRVEATTVVDLLRGDAVLIPAGSLLSGQVTAVDRATRTDRKGEMTVRFDALNSRGTTYPVRASVVQALESEGLKGEAGRIGAGAGVGAIIGGVLGGMKGAITGILIGGTGAVVATEGKDVELPAGTVLRLRIDSPIDVR